jgi:hypothetical protein
MTDQVLAGLINTLEMGKARFLYGLDRVPDDKLSWSPGGAAKSPLHLALKTAGFLRFTAQICRGVMPERGGPPEGEPTREQARAAVEAAYGDLIAAARELKPEELGKLVPTPFGVEWPLSRLVWLAPIVVGYHQGQLNYAQMAYGDEDPNIPPGWIEGSQ